MKIRSQSVLPAVVMIIAIFAVVTSIARVWQLSNWNSLYYENFETVFKDPDAVYDPVSVSKCQEHLYNYELSEESAAFFNTQFTLKKALNYYDAPGGSVVLTLEPGEYTSAAWYGDTSNLYGERSLPAGVEGWRYARPFVKSGEDAGECLYVKTSDLREINKQIMSDFSGNSDVIFGITEDHLGYSMREMPAYERYFLENDIVLYTHGVYCSPDGEAELFEPRTVFTGVAGIALIGWSIFLFTYNKRLDQKGKKA